MKRMLFVVVLLTYPLLAQQNTGRAAGSIIDASAAVVPGASVQLLISDSATVAASGITTTEGLYRFISIQPGAYDLVIEAKGFSKKIVRAIKIDPGRETSVPAITLEVGAVTETVEVSAQTAIVQATNAEVATTITTDQIRNLPLLDRNPLTLIGSQAGVASNSPTPVTVINGQRPSYTNMSFDGINVQDNYIRGNALDFLPNRLELDQVAEMTVLTSNSSAAVGGGASQIIFTSPSGANAFHGSAYWINRNAYFAANNWFNNRDGIANPPYNQNQGGGSLGGHIIRDKLFFYTNYEAFRLHQQSTGNRTILTADARSGIFTYRDSSGQVRKVNVLQAAGVSADPTIASSYLQRVPGPDKINNFRAGDSSEGLLRNTAGYSYVLRNNRLRDNVTGKVDYVRSSRNLLSGTFAWNREYIDRTDVTFNYDAVPPVFNDNRNKFVSATWRWNPKPSLTNELRGGFNLAPGVFLTSYENPTFNLAGTLFSSPDNFNTGIGVPQGRYTDTYGLQDNANYLRGRHSFQFGYQMQIIRVDQFISPADVVPYYTLGIGSGHQGLSSAQLPGISSADLTAANNLLANLAGYVTQYNQTFNVTSRTSGYVAGAVSRRHLTLNNHAAYFQDNMKLTPRLALNLGVRYDYYSPTDERDSLALLPVLNGASAISALLSNSTLDFAGSSVGRPWYKSDRNNFAPVAGFAYDVFGNGKTAIRGAYSLSYVNDELVRAAFASVGTNAGLSSSASRAGLSGTLQNLPAISTPAYKVPRTFQDNYQISTTTAFSMPDPNLVTPYVQQWSFGIQQSVKDTVIEVRYVGNHGVKEWRGIDYNQVIIRENGFLDDFKRAYNNGLVSQKQTGRFDPSYNPAIPGSQQLPVFNQLPGGGQLTNATILGYIQQQQAGELAAYYTTTGRNGDVSFYRNPYSYGSRMLTNFSNSTYHALQIDVRKHTRVGLYLQGNYTWSKALSDAAGDSQTRQEEFLDFNNAKIERSRTPFDLRHQIKINGSYELPLGKGHRLSLGKYDRVIGGWFLASIFTWQTGSPFSVLSGRGTLNRAGLSTNNTATSLVNADELNKLFRVRMTGVGPYYFDASAINPNDGRAVAPDGSANFPGQVFVQPNAGELGALQRRMFSGPSVWNVDFSVGKRTRITEHQTLEIRMDATNVANHPTWYVTNSTQVTNFTITSPQFGRITSNFFGRRLVQFGATYRF